MKSKTMQKKLFNQMVKDRKVRKAITRESFLYFFNFYFAHYITYPTADFQKEIIHSLEKSSVENLYIVSFRNSGKSTLVATAYPLWAILGTQAKQYILIFCKTQGQAKQSLRNIRDEAENNDLLKQDLGPFKEESETGKNGEWSSTSLVFSNTGARIKVASVDEGIRGLRHKQYRPDLILCDDVEDINSTRTRESRNKTYKWLRGDVIPAGDKNTRLIIIGNLLHENSLLMRMKADLEADRALGTFMKFPLINKAGECLWPGKYPDKASIEIQKKEIGNEIEWQREFLLNIVPDTEQVIHTKWIKYYPELPLQDRSFAGVSIGIDIAVSQKQAADYTAMVSAYVYWIEKEMYIYILPNPINQNMTSPQLLEKCKAIHKYYTNEKAWPKFIVEEAGQQLSVIQFMKDAVLNVQSFKPGQTDKRTRLALTALKINSGHILFPKTGCEELIRQLTGFGVERRDDLADAFSTLVLGLLEQPPRNRNSSLIIIDNDPQPLDEFHDLDEFRITRDMTF